MKATVLDTETGERRPSQGIPKFAWEEGNWSCDCNRATLFGDEVVAEMDRRMRSQHPELLPHQSCCFGSKRFIVVEAEPEYANDFPDDYPCVMAYLNEEYPAELLAAHGIPSPEIQSIEEPQPNSPACSACSTLGDELPREIERCQELLTAYAEIGPNGLFGAAMIRAEINLAHKAIMSGDVIAMMRSYQSLKQYHE